MFKLLGSWLCVRGFAFREAFLKLFSKLYVVTLDLRFEAFWQLVRASKFSGREDCVLLLMCHWSLACRFNNIIIINLYLCLTSLLRLASLVIRAQYSTQVPTSTVHRTS
jgi:hypothetical protein